MKCPSFLSPVFSCLSVTPSKTLCFLKSDIFVAATWQGGIIRTLHTICLLLRRTAITVLLTNLVKSDLNHRSLSFCPVPCPFPPLSLTSFHLLLTMSFAFSFPLISQQLSPQLASLRVFPPGCLILSFGQICLSHPPFTSSIFLVLTVLSSLLIQRVPRWPHWGWADRWAPPLHPWDVFSTTGSAREG